MNTIERSDVINTTSFEKKVLSTAREHTTGGRDGGASRSSDGRLDIKLSVPGHPGSSTNPEQLFAEGGLACFIGAIYENQAPEPHPRVLSGRPRSGRCQDAPGPSGP